MNFSEALEQMISNHKTIRIFRTILSWNEREHNIIVESDLSQNVDKISIDDFVQIYKLFENEELFYMEGEGMNFTEALKMMKAGIPMKLPSWGGYWFWDPEKETIMMKCRKIDSETGKDLLDIRETQRVEYTLANILSDEWVPATEENTTILGGTPTFSFGDAIKYLKRGMKVKRQGWNGKNQYIQLAKNISYVTSDGSVQNCDHDAIGNMAIAFVGTSGVQMGWFASQADMLAEDWVFAE